MILSFRSAVFCFGVSLFSFSISRVEAVDPEIPAINRDVVATQWLPQLNANGTLKLDAAGLPGAMMSEAVHTRPHIPAYRTTYDSRVGCTIFADFALIMPEKATLLGPMQVNDDLTAASGVSERNVFKGNASFMSSSNMTGMKSKKTGNPADRNDLGSKTVIYYQPSTYTTTTVQPSNRTGWLRYTDGVIGMCCLYDPPKRNNPSVFQNGTAFEDLYDIYLIATMSYAKRATWNASTNAWVDAAVPGDNIPSLIVSNRIKVYVSNPKSPTAAIRLVELQDQADPNNANLIQYRRYSRIFDGVDYKFSSIIFENNVSGNGGLFVARCVAENRMKWRDPNQNTVVWKQTLEQLNNIFYIYYHPDPNNDDDYCDASKWDNIIPITYAPYDKRINGEFMRDTDPNTKGTEFGFAMQPFRRPDGVLYNGVNGEDLAGTYPWIDKDANNLFFASVDARLYETPGNLGAKTDGISRYDATPVYSKTLNPVTDPEDQAAINAGEVGSPNRCVSFIGLWSHGKAVMLDNLNSEHDYSVGSQQNHPTEHRWVKMYEPNTGINGGVDPGLVHMGAGRATQNLPKLDSGNSTFQDSIENRFYYRNFTKPSTIADVVWPFSTVKATDEINFDNYMDEDMLIYSTMVPAQLGPLYKDGGRMRFPYYDGFYSASFGKIRLANQSTAHRRLAPPTDGTVTDGTPDARKNSVSKLRAEPLANGGIFGRGFWMNGYTGIRYTIPNTVDLAGKDWYVGLFIDQRSNQAGREAKLIRFTNGGEIRLFENKQIRYYDQDGDNRATIILPQPDSNVNNKQYEDLVPYKGWAHLAFQITDGGRQVEFLLNGLPYHRWFDNMAPRLFNIVKGGVMILGTDINTPTVDSDSDGFIGWIDNFTVINRILDYESTCNQAGGTLVGFSSTITAEINTKLAAKYPGWTHRALTLSLASRGEPTYQRYACFYSYRRDNGARLDNLPAGTVSLRASMHLPEGPLLKDMPRPDSSKNRFCLSCHDTDGNGGLSVAALVYRPTKTSGTATVANNAPGDPRRQPAQPLAKIYGVIPAGLVNITNQPASRITSNSSGYSTDEAMQDAYNANEDGKITNFYLVEEGTDRVLTRINSDSTAARTLVDPARYGVSKFAIRVVTATNHVDVKIKLTGGDLATPNEVTLAAPKYEFNFSETRGAGDYTMEATATVPGKTGSKTLTAYFTYIPTGVRNIANFKDEADTPTPFWSYEWNAKGGINGIDPNNLGYKTSPARQMVFNSNFIGAFTTPVGLATRSPNGIYTSIPTLTLPTTNAAGAAALSADYLRPGLTSNETGAVGVNNSLDRYTIASFNVVRKGRYAIADGIVQLFKTGGDGICVRLYYEKADANGIMLWNAVGTAVSNPPGNSTAVVNFGNNANWNIPEELNPGDKISIAVGGKRSNNTGTATSLNDECSLNFRIRYSNGTSNVFP
jgi:hypothetical protein